VAVSVSPDAAKAVLRAGAPIMIRIAAMIGQKMMKRTISGKVKELFAHENTRKDAKNSKVKIDRIVPSGKDALVFELWVMAEVHEQI